MANDVYKGLTIEFRAKTTGVSEALTQLSKESRKVQSEIKNIDKALNLDPGNVELLRQKEEAARKQAETLRDRLTAINAALVETDRNSNAYKKLQQDLSLTSSKLKQVESAAESAGSALRAMENYGADVSRALEAKWNTWNLRSQSFGEMAQGFEKSASAFSSAGRTLTYSVTPAVLGVGAAALKTSIDYESAFAGVRKTVDMTEGEFEKLYNATIALSETTPVSATDLMAIEELGGQLGIANDSMLDFAETISKISTSTNLGIEDAATEFAQFANITNMSQKDFDKLGATLVDLGNNAATTESDIMAMAMRIAGAGTSAGMSVQDIMAMSTTLSSLGINAEAGGTAISTIISNIDKQVATNGKNLKTWASTTGQSAEDFAQAWRDDPVIALAAVVSGMANMQDEGGNLAILLEELGVTSIRQTDAFKRMANSGDLFNRTLATSRNAWDENSALNEEVSRRYETTASKVEILKNRITNVASTLGGPLAEALVGAIDAAEPFIKTISGMAQNFANMDEKDRRFILSIAGMVAALGPALSILGKISSVGSGIMRGLENFSSNRAATYKAAFENLNQAMSGTSTSAGKASNSIRDINTAAKNADNLSLSKARNEIDLTGTTASTTAEKAAKVKSGINTANDANLSGAVNSYNDLNKKITDTKGNSETVKNSMKSGVSANLVEAAGKSYAPVNTIVNNTKANAQNVKNSMKSGVSVDLTEAVNGSYDPVNKAASTASAKARDVKTGIESANLANTSNAQASISNIGKKAKTTKTEVSGIGDKITSGVSSADTSHATTQYTNIDSAVSNTKGNVSSVGAAIEDGSKTANTSVAQSKLKDVSTEASNAKTSVSGVGDAVTNGSKTANTSMAKNQLNDVSEKAGDVKKEVSDVGSKITSGAKGANTSDAVKKLEDIETSANNAKNKVGNISTEVDTLNKKSTGDVQGQIGSVGSRAITTKTHVDNVAKSVEKVDGKKLKNAVSEFGGLGEAAKGAAGFIGSTLAGAIASLGMMAVIGGVFAIAGEFAKMKEEADNFNTALEGVSTSLANIDTKSLDDTADSFQNTSDKIDGAKDSIDEYLSTHLETISQIKSNWDEINANSILVGNYRSTIEELTELAETSELSAKDQTRLKAAIEGVNAVCGTNYSVIDAANGVLSENASAILASIDAWEEYARVQGYMSTLTSLYADLAKAQVALTGAQDAYNAVLGDLKNDAGDTWAELEGMLDRYLDLATNYDAGIEIQAAFPSIYESGLLELLVQAKGNLEDMQAQYDAVAQSCVEWEDAATDAASRTNENIKSIEEYLSSIGGIKNIMNESGQPVLALASALDSAGVSAETLKSKAEGGLGGFLSIANNFDGTIESITGDLADMGIVIDQAADSEQSAASDTEDLTQALQDYQTSCGETVKVTEDQATAMDAFSGHVKDVSDKMSGLNDALKSAILAGTGNGLTAFGLQIESTGGSIEHLQKVYDGLSSVTDPFSEYTHSLSDLDIANISATASAEELEAAMQNLAPNIDQIAGNIDDQYETVTRFNAVVKSLYAQCETEADIEFVNQLVEKGPSALGELENINSGLEGSETTLHNLADTYALTNEAAADGAVMAELERMAAAYRVFGEEAFTAAYMVDESTGNIKALVGEGADAVIVEFDSATGEVVRILDQSAPEFESEAAELKEATANGLDGVQDDMAELADKGAEEFSSGIKEGASDASDSASFVGDQTYDALVSFPDEMEARGKVGGWSFASGVSSQKDQAYGAGETLASQVTSGLSSASDDAYSIGKNITLGLASGMLDWSALTVVSSAARYAVTQAINEAKAAADINSPSRVMEDVGINWDLGLANGIDKSIKAVQQSARNVMRQSINAAQIRTGSGTVTNSTTTNVYVNGAKVNDDPAIQNVTREFLYELKREAVI